ncbi:MAG TPA: amino acid adenylation domain-containing protein [Solirubrobacterales bacterium]|nr:amino acid adenylation domain-containing protein [Solirubrobacterales bacterium]
MLLHAPIEEQAAETPEAIAVRVGGRSLSYGELDRRAGLLALDLRRRGVGPGSLVGICAERSFELVIGLVGVLKAGAAYLPLDPSYPPRRLAETLDDAGPAVVLADAAGRGAIPSPEPPRLVHLERVASLSSVAPSPAADRREPHPDELAYVIYTSGSSGRPKGVMCTHRGIGNRIRWMQERYRLTPRDRVLHKTSIGFDVSVWELFWPLRTGAQLVLAKPGEHRDPDALGATMREAGVTVAHFVPAMLAAFISSGQLDTVGSLRTVVCSGEALAPGLRDRFFAHCGAELHNLYGPTEASVDVTHHACAKNEVGSSVPIGKAIDGVRVDVLDEGLRSVAPGSEGEICISGVALARGYLGRPALTASAFVPDPLGDGSRLYRTGDRGRFLPGGEIEFLGRRDDQVKIRGVRIELGEVESAMASLPGVEQAAVALVGEGAAGRLVGCVTGPCGSPEQLRRELRERLPEQAVPADLIQVDALPTLANGKTDRGALATLVAGPAAVAGGATSVAAPETPEEEALAQIWRDVLGLPAVTPEDNFFSLGGDSIRSIEVVARARAAGLRLSTSDVFAHPTLRDLARRVGAGEDAGQRVASSRAFALVAPGDRALLPADVVDAVPLSSLMAGLVAESLENPDYLVYTTTLCIEGSFERAALEAAVSTLVRRHATLRSAIDVESFGEPLQLVYRSLSVPVAEVDARGLARRAWEQSFGEWLERERRTPFDWRRPPLVRFTAHRRGEDRWQLTMSEPFLDGWSAAVVLAELLRAYRDGVEGGLTGSAPPRVSNRDLVVAERKAESSVEHRTFWRERLAGAPATRLSRLAEASGDAGHQRRVSVPIPAEVSRGLTTLAKDLDVPLKSVLLASHARTMAALTGQDEVVCGLMVNGRSEEPDGERAVGLFLNTLPVRLRIGDCSWADLARAAHAAEAEILPWRRYPYARILHDCGGRHLFDSVFNFTHFRPYAEFGPGSAVRVRSIQGSDQTYFPITAQFGLDPFGGGVELALELNPDRFAGLQVEQLVDLHARALAEIARDPGARHSEGSLVGPGEQSVRARWPASRDRPPDRGTRLEDLFDRQADAFPEGIAIFDERERLSFDQVRSGAGRLAFELRSLRGGEEPRRVGACMERRPAVLEAVLASLRLGAAFVPLDCELPAPRLRAILDDADLDAVIADARGAGAISAAAADWTGPLVRIDTLSRRGPRVEEFPRRAAAEGPAQILYTSGSTGRPKGVVASHRALVNRLRWMWDAYPFEAGEVCCMRGSLGFVDSVTSLLGGVLAGVPTYVLSDERQEPDAIARALDEAGVTRLTIVPALLQSLLTGCSEKGKARLGRIGHWVLSGEPLSGDLVGRLRRVAPRATVLNLYGSTEVAGDVTAYECRGHERGKVPVGNAIDAMRARVLDRWDREAPCGAEGEVIVEGPGLAEAYLGDPRMTADRFRPSPNGHGARVFLTGDLGRRRVDGALEICGRVDRQVKVNGVRVEPAEVEAVLAAHPLVAGCGVVTPPAGASPSADLVAFVELADSTGPGDRRDASRELRDFLRGRLPSPMVPGKVVVETALPRTTSGKIDRSTLASRAVEPGVPSPERPPGTPLEELIARVWAEELGAPSVGAEEDFFSLGGDSLTAVRVLARLSGHLGVDLALRDLFDHPTIRGFACRAEAALIVDVPQEDRQAISHGH